MVVGINTVAHLINSPNSPWAVVPDAEGPHRLLIWNHRRKNTPKNDTEPSRAALAQPPIKETAADGFALRCVPSRGRM